MALTLLQIVKGDKSFKGKSIAEIDHSFWILYIFWGFWEYIIYTNKNFKS